jgi:hypothetical protein
MSSQARSVGINLLFGKRYFFFQFFLSVYFLKIWDACEVCMFLLTNSDIKLPNKKIIEKFDTNHCHWSWQCVQKYKLGSLTHVIYYVSGVSSRLK